MAVAAGTPVISAVQPAILSIDSMSIANLEKHLSRLETLMVKTYGVAAHGPTISVEVFIGEKGRALFLSGVGRVVEAARTLREYDGDVPKYKTWACLINSMVLTHYCRALKQACRRVVYPRGAREIVSSLSENGLPELQRRVRASLPASFRALAGEKSLRVEALAHAMLYARPRHLRRILMPLFPLCQIDQRLRRNLCKSIRSQLGHRRAALIAYLYIDPVSAVAIGGMASVRSAFLELQHWLLHSTSRFDTELAILLLAQLRANTRTQGIRLTTAAVGRCLSVLRESPNVHSQLAAADLIARDWPRKAAALVADLEWRTAAVLLSSLAQHAALPAERFQVLVRNWNLRSVHERHKREISAANRRFIRSLEKRVRLPARLSDALRHNPRELYVPILSRQTAYDLEEAQEIGFRQTISAPIEVIRLLKLLNPKPGDTVLDIGSGSGWLAALLSSLTHPDGRVVSIERIPSLTRMAEINANYLGGHDVSFIEGDGSQGCSALAKYNCVVAAAGTRRVAKRLMDQFGRIMVMPVGGRRPFEYRLTAFTRDRSGAVRAHKKCNVRFVPMIRRIASDDSRIVTSA